VRVPSGLALVSAVSGKEIQVRVDVTLGSGGFRQLDDPEVRYVSAEQCKLSKIAAMGGWIIQSVPYASNPMYINDAPIEPAGVLLREGDRLSIKGLYFRLSVRLLS
jgi:hypothetical protein